jgi:hypothetical protein
MCLASVKEIVYLQWDQGEFLIGNMMYNATRAHGSGFLSPRPLSADVFGLEYFTQLNDGNVSFEERIADEPFYTHGANTVKTPSVASFLCTDVALNIYSMAARELENWTTLNFPGYVPPDVPKSALTNEQVLAEVKDFLFYTQHLGNRGTPHRV